LSQVLDLLEVLIEARGYGYERLDGNDRGVSRQQAIDRFSTPQVMTSDGPSRTASRMALLMAPLIAPLLAPFVGSF
jgi:hypothetical protein